MRIQRNKQLTGKTSRSGGIRGSESFFWNLRNSASIKAVAAFFAATNQLSHSASPEELTWIIDLIVVIW
jgi:hypothetical protein